MIYHVQEIRFRYNNVEMFISKQRSQGCVTNVSESKENIINVKNLEGNKIMDFSLEHVYELFTQNSFPI